MTIDVCFSGWLRGVEVEHVIDFSDPQTGIRELSVSSPDSFPNQIELSNEAGYKKIMSQDEFIEHLREYSLVLSLSELLKASNKKDNVNIFDFAKGT